MPQSGGWRNWQRHVSTILVVASFLLITALNLDTPGRMLERSGRADLALPCFQIMTQLSVLLPINNQRRVAAYSNMAACLFEQGETSEAIDVQQLTLEQSREIFGQDSKESARETVSLAKYLNKIGKYQRSEMILSQAVQRQSRLPFCDIEATALLSSALADSYILQNKLPAAEVVLEQLQPIDESCMRNRGKSVDTHDKLADIYMRTGRDDLARRFLEHGLILKERWLGPQHAQTVTTRKTLGGLHTTALVP